MKIAGGLAIGLLIVGGLLGLLDSDFLKSDRCLDAGGRWDKITNSCDLEG